MGSLENRLRRKWQKDGGEKASQAELSFYEIFETLFKGTEFELIRKPTKFNKVYVDYPLSKQELKEIYIPDKKILKHGFVPDCLIRNKNNNKEIYIEIKRQDGWVEGKKGSDGRGNVHERLCKYLTPGLLNLLRKEGNINAPHFPFWIVLQGDITRDICRVREIRFWFEGHEENITF